jgi:hypothetical protein
MEFAPLIIIAVVALVFFGLVWYIITRFLGNVGVIALKSVPRLNAETNHTCCDKWR